MSLASIFLVFVMGVILLGALVFFTARSHVAKSYNLVISIENIAYSLFILGTGAMLGTIQTGPNRFRDSKFPTKDNQIGELIKGYRRKRGWSQARLARTVYVSPGYISKLENGEVLPSIELCERIAEVLGIEKNSLLHLFIEKKLGIPIDTLFSIDRDLTERDRYYLKLIEEVPANIRHEVIDFLEKARKFVRDKEKFTGLQEEVKESKQNEECREEDYHTS